MMSKSLQRAVVAGIALTGTGALADTFQIDPGLWEFTAETSIGIPGRSHVTQQCIQNSDFDPRSMNAENEGCQITEQTVEASKMSFAMSCNQSGGSMNMRGVYESFGDSLIGTVNMEMKFGEQTMKQRIVWKGERVDDC